MSHDPGFSFGKALGDAVGRPNASIGLSYQDAKEQARAAEEARLQAMLYGRPPKHTASDRSSYSNERFGTGTGKAKRFPKPSNPRAGQRRSFEFRLGIR